MMMLDRSLRGVPADRMARSLQIIEMLESTAERLPRSFTRRRLDRHGHGRVNAWKSILAVLNDGVASNKGPHFGSLADSVRMHPATEWYGFEIITDKMEEVWLDDVRLFDQRNSFVPDGCSREDGSWVVCGYKGISPTSTEGTPTRVPAGVFQPGTGGPFEGELTDQVRQESAWVTTFSIRRADLHGRSRLVVHGFGDDSDDEPVYDIQLARITNVDREDRGVGLVPDRGVTFEDFVFTVDTRRATERRDP